MNKINISTLFRHYPKKELIVTIRYKTNSISIDEELIKAKIEYHSLRSESDFFYTTLNDEGVEDTVEKIPEVLKDTDTLKDKITSIQDASKNIIKRRIYFSDLEEFKSIYSLGKISAISDINFLKSVDKDFLEDSKVHNRIFVETEPREFLNFYGSLSIEEKNFFKSLPKFQIISHTQENAGAKPLYNQDFALIEIGSEKLVTYSYRDVDGIFNAWISWREIDKKFFEELYSIVNKTSVNYVGVEQYLDKFK